MDVVVDQEESRCATWKMDGRDAETDLGAVVIVVAVVLFAVLEVKAEAELGSVEGTDMVSCSATAAASIAS